MKLFAGNEGGSSQTGTYAEVVHDYMGPSCLRCGRAIDQVPRAGVD